MTKYLLKRLLQAIGVIFAISLITFFILNIVPGDPVQLMLGDFATPDAIEAYRHQMGLDKPVMIQYLNWLKGMLTGDFGTSYYKHTAVLTLLSNAFSLTARLAVFAYALALLIGLTFGILAAVMHNSVVDRLLMTLAVTGISAPNFWIAIILQIVFGLTLKWFPLSGTATWQCYVLPAVALGLRYAASIARITRTSMLEVMQQDYMRTARAKGLGTWTIIMRHAFRNALVPVVTVAGTDLGNILTGSMLIESVFAINGIGKLMIDSINQRDLPLVQGGVMYIAVICVVIYFIVDMLYAVIDPRIHIDGGSST